MLVADKYVFFWGDVPFTNFTVHPFPYPSNQRREHFFSSEQAFMWEKARFFKDTIHAREIRSELNPKKAKALGRLVKPFDEKRWYNASYDIMYECVKAKFDCVDEYRKELLNSEYDGKTFVEASPYDRIWGIGFGEKEALEHECEWGENRLGKILTRLRDEYRDAKDNSEPAE